MKKGTKMKEVRFWLVAIHTIKGVHSEKIILAENDEDYLNEDWDDFDEYVQNFKEGLINEYEQRCYTAIIVNNYERLNIIEQLSK